MNERRRLLVDFVTEAVSSASAHSILTDNEKVCMMQSNFLREN